MQNPLQPTRPLPRLKGDDRRTHCVSVRLNAFELQKLAAWARGSNRKLGQVLREIALLKTPPIVPVANQAHWESLARALGNLNQVAYSLNQGLILEDVRPLLSAVLIEVIALRAELRGEEARP